MSNEPNLILKRYWGYDRFRPPQKEIITSVLNGQDAIALLPTGGGKSLCYQLPSLLLPGKTVVISPLISLMQDQVEELSAKEIHAKAIYTGMSQGQIEGILDSFVHGPLKLLYVSPERILTESFQTRFYMANVSLIAVDEAHCISQWGHDFRPSYLNINMLREIKPDVPIIALTATATQPIIEDISEQLALKNPVLYRNSFARDNISFTSIRTEDKTIEFEKLIRRLKGSGIVYTRSRLRAVKIANWLVKHKIKALHYHGGMNPNERASSQKKWMQNKVQVIVATNAFGMGINKPDVRFVIHLDIPPSIEEYYQEAGRAGRDGKMSFAISLISNQDLMSSVKNFENYHPDIEEIKKIYIAICKYLKLPYDDGEGKEYFLDVNDLSTEYKIPVSKIFTTIKILEKQGWLTISEGLRTPSQVFITTNPRTINDIYEPTDPRYLVLSQLLRSYEGIFNEFVNINEANISRILNLSVDKIIGYLKVLQNEAVIYYNSSSDLPKITFLKARPHDESFRIDERAYQLLKDNARNKLNSIITFHSTDQCRQQLILNYFGETDAISCGQCDYCLGSAEKTYDDSIKLEVMNRFKQSPNGISAKQLILHFPYNKRNRVFQCLDDLEAENQIRVDEKGNLRLNNN